MNQKTRQIMSLQLDDGRYFICIRVYGQVQSVQALL